MSQNIEFPELKNLIWWDLFLPVWERLGLGTKRSQIGSAEQNSKFQPTENAKHKGFSDRKTALILFSI